MERKLGVGAVLPPLSVPSLQPPAGVTAAVEEEEEVEEEDCVAVVVGGQVLRPSPLCGTPGRLHTAQCTLHTPEGVAGCPAELPPPHRRTVSA